MVCSGKDGRSSAYFYVRLFAISSWKLFINFLLSLIFPRWDVVVIILSMFLMTYTYIEAKSNYHRGSILILRQEASPYLLLDAYPRFSYLVLAAGFYYAPQTGPDSGQGHSDSTLTATQQFSALTGYQYTRWYLTSWWY